jgi:beta-galactosidase
LWFPEGQCFLFKVPGGEMNQFYILLPHWNWSGMEGKEIDVWAYSNCDEVELFLNKKSLGKKKMEQNGHLEWKVKYDSRNVGSDWIQKREKRFDGNSKNNRKCGKY